MQNEQLRITPGVWCLSADRKITSPAEWNEDMQAQGCLVATEETAFIVALHPSVALPWGAMDQAKAPLVRDKATFNCKAATDAMLKAYEGVAYKDNDGAIWDVEGAPAASWCRQYSHGNIGVGSWDLPTVAQLLLMSKHRDEINDCLSAMHGFKLPAGYHYSSIEQSESCAWLVVMYGGRIDSLTKYDAHYVRAVSAFPL